MHVYIHVYKHVYIHVYIHRFSDMESPAAETTTLALQHSNIQVKYMYMMHINKLIKCILIETAGTPVILIQHITL